MVKLEDLEFEFYKQFTDSGGRLHHLGADVDMSEIDIITDSEGNVLMEVETGGCACRFCREC